ncbi:MAG: LL-diaminopimelate aminotransferase [Chloroflexi bacterium RBG_13_51_36]|nr:MAG: LL-diaminopimelate aminotransferase [Chloroflexi bacterium RBG_13_51_36]
MELAKRLNKLPPYLFVEINRKVAELEAKGRDIINFGIGDPDLPTPSHIIEKLCQAAHDPVNHRYPETGGLLELRQAIAEWYQRRFGVTLNPAKEVLPLVGSKEGIGHMALCFIEPGDLVLVPDPGYPPFSMGTILAGGETYLMPLKEENDFLPDFEAIPDDVADKAKLMWLNYPNNPTGGTADIDFFQEAVHFAQRHGLAVCHDAPYTEIAFDGYKPPSFLQIPEAKKIGVEFHSLSKTYHMTGWRIGMVVGNADMVNALFKVKSNLDSGIPQAIQYAAVEALRGPQDHIAEHNGIFQRRRDKLVKVLDEVGIDARIPRATFYIWARTPQGYASIDFAKKLLEEVGIAVTPGVGYGREGEGYIRFSLTISDDRLEEGVNRLLTWRRRRI